MPDSSASSNLGRKLQKLRELEARERRQLAQLGFLLLFAWFTLRVFGFNNARRWAEFALPVTTTSLSAADLQRGQDGARLVSIAARNGLYHANCLHQSLALCRMLRSQGLPALIRIGVQSRAGLFQAHAWVELEHVPLGQTVEQYSAFDSLTAARERAPIL